MRIANSSLQDYEMLAVDEHFGNLSVSLAAGERVNAKPANCLTWCLPRVITVTQDALLQASYEHRHSIINNIVFKDMLHLRELLIYRRMAFVEPHKLQKLDQKIRYLDDMVDSFIKKWTYQTNIWSRNATSKEFLGQYAQLTHKIIEFIGNARNVMQYAQGLLASRL